jgi:hypothetical protein
MQAMAMAARLSTWCAKSALRNITNVPLPVKQRRTRVMKCEWRATLPLPQTTRQRMGTGLEAKHV